MILTAIEMAVAITCIIGLILDWNEKFNASSLVKGIGLVVIAVIGIVAELQ